MSEPEYTKSKTGTVRPITETVNLDYGELTRAEIRTRIGAAVGLNTNPTSSFGKAELNSIHAYITGRWYFNPRLYTTPESPSTPEVRMQVAIVAGIEEFIPPPDAEPTYTPERPFRKSELAELAEAVENQSDSRPTPDR